MTRGVARLIHRLAEFFVAAACVAAFLMMAHVTADVSSRYLLNRPLAGTLEMVSGYYMVIVVFGPLAYVLRGEGHIIVELFTRGLKPSRLAGLDVAMGLISIVYLAVFAWMAGYEAALRTREGEVWDIGVANMAIWPSRWIVPIGIGLMALAIAVRVVQDFRRARGP